MRPVLAEARLRRHPGAQLRQVEPAVQVGRHDIATPHALGLGDAVPPDDVERLAERELRRPAHV